MSAPTEIVRSYNHHYNGRVLRRASGKYVGIKCSWYHPCPIDYRCQAAAPHMYKRCEDCPAIGCTHTTKEKERFVEWGNQKLNNK